VIRAPGVDELQAADDPGANDDLVAHDGALADHADVQGIAVAPLRGRGESTHMLSAVGPWDEPVQRRVLRGRALRSIDAQISRHLVDLVLHQVERRNLDERVEDLWRIGAHLQAVPRVPPEMADLLVRSLVHPPGGRDASSYSHPG